MKLKPVWAAAAAAFMLFLLLAPAARSAAPALLSYQGTLRKNGALFTGLAPMEFSITNADGSVIYWASGSTDVVVTAGLFRYALGAQNAPAFAAIPWGDITPFVRMTVDGGPLPGEPLYSSAYSMHAAHAVSAESSAGDFTAHDGDIRISTTSGSKGLVFQNGTAQYSAAGWTLSGSNAYTTFAGNAGIGTNGPQARLDVQAAGPYSQIWRDASGVIKASVTASGMFYGDASGMRNLPSGADNLGNHTATRDLDLTGNNEVNVNSISGYNQALRIGSDLWLLNSRFGIGTNAPAAQLHISTSAGSSGDMLVISTGAIKVIRMTGAGAVYATKYYGDGSSLTGVSGGGGGGSDNLGNHTLTQNLVTGPYWVSSDGSNTGLNLDSAGNVGIGQTAGSAKLDVRGSVGNYIQIWRDNSNVVKASMTVLGMLYADGSQLRNLPQDNLGNHTATQNLNMASKEITAVSTITVSTITVGYLSSQGPGVVFTTNALVMGGRLGIDTQSPQEKLHVQGNILSSSLGGSGNRCVYADNAGVLRISSDACGLAGVSGDNLGNYIMLQNLNTNGKWISGDGTGNGLTVGNTGNVGVGFAGATTRLDVQAAALDSYVQIWRNSGGVAVASMTSAGLLYADASGMRNLPSGADNLGSHTATKALNMAGWQILNVDSITVTGPQGAGFIKARLSAGVEISSASSAQLGGVYVSTNIYVVGVASATRYYGDGSQLTGLTGVADNLGNHTATQNLNMASKEIMAVSTITVSTITVGYLSSQGLGVVFTTNALVMGGRLGIDTQSPQEKLHVQGNILSSTLGGSGNRCVYADNAGVLRIASDACGLAGVSGDNLGNYVMLQNLNTNGKWISGDGTGNGLTVGNTGNVGVGFAGATTRLDVQAAALDSYVQIWRNSGGVAVASMTSAGLLYADASGMRNLPSGADNLGNHTAAQDLNLASHNIINVSTITAGYITSAGAGVVFSTHVLISEGNLGLAVNSPQERLHVNGNILSSNLSGASNRCVYVDQNGVLRAKATDCGSVSATGDNLGDHKMLQNLNTSGNWLSGDGNNRGLLVDVLGNVSVTDILYSPAARLDVRGAVGNYIQAWRNVAGVIQASMSVTGVLYADASGLRNLPSDNLGNHILAQNLATNSHWISSDGDSEGVYVDAAGRAGLGQYPPAAQLDVKSVTGDTYAQIWRDSGGVTVASMTAAGLLYADASKLRNIPSSADNLGSHIATATLRMSGFGIVNAGAITANGQITTYSSVTVAGAQGLGTARVQLNPSVVLSSASAAQLGGVYVSSNIYVVGVASATRYYGDGSQLTGLTGVADNLGNHTATQNLNMAAKDITNVSTITAGYLSSQGLGVVFTTNALVMGGRLGIDTQSPQEKLHVQGNILSSSLGGSGNRCVYADNAGVLRIASDACGLAGVSGDNLGNYVMLQNLNTNGKWISGDGASGGLTVGITGNVGIGLAGASTRLDVQAASADGYVQIWRDSFGASIASMTSAGLLYADASGMRNLPGGADNLGSHTATKALNMAGWQILNVDSITVTGPQGAGFYKATLSPGVDLSSASPAQLGGIYVSTNIYVVGVASATRYYGDGSQLTGLTGVADNLGNHTATQNLNMAAKDITNVSTITAGYLSSQGLGVVFTTNALVMGGRLGIDTQSPQEKLHVQGNILSSSLSGLGNRCVYADSTGVLRVTSDACGSAGGGGDNLGNHMLAQNLVTGSHWISYDGSSGGLSVNISSNVGIGIQSAETRLDVQPAEGDGYSQIWRNSSGVIVASMTADGKLYANGSGLSGVALGGGGGGCVNPNDAGDIMVAVGDFCVDKYEASVWSGPAGGTQYGAPTIYPCGANGQDCATAGATKIYARSAAGVTPSSGITWFQANVACINSGKHLLTNAEWQAAVTGTTDPGGCNVSGTSPTTTGAGAGCLSTFGVENMIGSLGEWVAEFGATAVTGNLSAAYGSDASYGPDPEHPISYSAMVRGGSYAMNTGAGAFALVISFAPSDSDAQIGFRCGMRR